MSKKLKYNKFKFILINYSKREIYLLLVMLIAPLQILLASNQINTISAKDLYEKHLNNKEYVLIDNRPKEKFNSGHIKGAINLIFSTEADAQNTLTKESLEKISENKIIIFYCSGFSRAPNAIQTAITKWKIDPRRLLLFKGGMMEWSQQNYPIVMNH